MPAVNRVSSRQQISEFRVRPPLAEDVSNLVEVVRQAFARKVEHKWLAETKIALVGNRDVLLVVFNVVGEFVFLLAGKFNVHVNLTSRLAHNGLVLAEDALKGDKLQRVDQFGKAHGH